MVDKNRASEIREFWEGWFSTGGNSKEKRLKKLLWRLPSNPRCKFCNAPFRGIGAPIARILWGKRPSGINPRFCNVCDEFARNHLGGAEVEMSMLFADIRGSTALSEKMTPLEFSQLINRFYITSTRTVVEYDGVVEKLAGDAIAAFWGAGFAGAQYVQRTIEAAKALLLATGHDSPAGRWVPLGIGVHAGKAFFGSVGTSDGLTNITAVGEQVNTAARLAAAAAPGEIIVSAAAFQASGMHDRGYERRTLTLKGISSPVNAFVLRAADKTTQA